MKVFRLWEFRLSPKISLSFPVGSFRVASHHDSWMLSGFWNDPLDLTKPGFKAFKLKLQASRPKWRPRSVDIVVVMTYEKMGDGLDRLYVGVRWASHQLKKQQTNKNESFEPLGLGETPGPRCIFLLPHRDINHSHRRKRKGWWSSMSLRARGFPRRNHRKKRLTGRRASFTLTQMWRFGLHQKCLTGSNPSTNTLETQIQKKLEEKSSKQMITSIHSICVRSGGFRFFGLMDLSTPRLKIDMEGDTVYQGNISSY